MSEWDYNLGQRKNIDLNFVVKLALDQLMYQYQSIGQA